VSESSESPLAWLWRILAGLLAVALCVAVVGFFWIRFNVNYSLDRADGFELTQSLKRWIEAGRPEGEKLTEFMQGRRADIVVSNRVFGIGGTNYVTQFAVTKPKSHKAATIFVTTNEVLTWLDSSGNVKIFSMNPGRP